jgi:uncharacterized protein with ParB-like and HNH nuclease domain
MPTILKQEQPTFGSLAGNGRTFEVPPFQRDYSWDKEEWEDLWLDIIGIAEEGDHYMGYVVLQETKESKNFLIIDGQQRITTISILIIAAVKLLSDWGDDKRAEDLRNQYLSVKEPVSQIYKTKLKLNRNNDYVYSLQLIQLQIPQFMGSLKPSEKRIFESFKYFYKQLKSHFESNKSTADLTALISKTIDEKLFFTSIIVNDDIDAYKVFETLNARGVKLSTADLLKNYLFSKVFSKVAGEIDVLEKKWYRINDLLGKTDITRYIRHFWNSRNTPKERKATLFKTIKKKVNTYELSIDLINALDENVLIYAALINPDSEIWFEEQSKYIREINILEVSQCFPLLMVAKQKLSTNEFTKLLRDIVAISFRYNTIGGQNPNALEDIYNQASVGVFNGSLTSAKEVFFNHLKDVYLDDNSFKNDFKNKQLNTNKYNQLVKYILSKLEAQYGGVEPILTNKNLTIEHILPESPNDEWLDSFTNVDCHDYIYRLGNLTILESSKNKEADRKVFAEKQEIYATSNYKLSKELVNFNDWSVASISDNQRNMANRAATVWKINYK